MLREKVNQWIVKVAAFLILGVLMVSGGFTGLAQTSAAPAEKSSIVVATEFDTTLLPGVWHGFVLGPASAKRGFIVEISPLQPTSDGAHIERYVVQPEFNGMVWDDVVRVQIPVDQPELNVNIRVYAVQTTK